MMNIFRKLIKGLNKPSLFGIVLISTRLSRIFPDSLQISLSYRLRIGKKLNLEEPRSFNEKLQWLKLNDRNPFYTNLVDKYSVRQYIKDTIGEKYLVPLISVYDRVEDIDYSFLPERFVLKPTHTSGNVIVCRNKADLDIKNTNIVLNKWMKREYFWYHREWPYKNIIPRIICEEFLVDESGYELKDYKFYCFNGDPKLIQVMSNRNSGNYSINHFDKDWNVIEIKRKSHNPSPNNIKRPEMLADMLQICELLSKDIPFVRVDLYFANNSIYFGELTFYPVSGYVDYVNEEDDYLLGSWVDLSLVKGKS